MQRYQWTEWGLVDTLGATISIFTGEFNVQGESPRLGEGGARRLPSRPAGLDMARRETVPSCGREPPTGGG